MSRSPLLALTALILIATPSRAATWHIQPDGTGDAPTIQSAIVSAAPGDTVLLAPGTFTGPGNRDLVFGGKDLVLMGELGADSTTIDCQLASRGMTLGSGQTSATVVEGITLRNGLDLERGGGVLVAEATPTIRHCVFDGNSSPAGGAVTCDPGNDTTGQSSPTISFSRFVGNVSEFGGGLWTVGDRSHPVIEDCVFEGNSATGGYEVGGALAATSASIPTIRRCRFSGNSAGNAGGAAFFGTMEGATLTLVECTFSGNTAAVAGGAAACADGSVRFESCTFHANSAPLAGGLWAAGFGLGPASVTMSHTIVAHSTLGSAAACDSTSTIDLECCNLWGNAGGDYVDCLAGQLGGAGNLLADPMFCDAPGGDFRLDSLSPCLNPAGCDRIGAFGVGCGPTAILTDDGRPAGSGLRLTAPSPNPVGRTTTIRFALPSRGPAELTVVDVTGRSVAVLARGTFGRRWNEALWDGSNAAGEPVAPGVYFLRLEAAGAVRTQKVVKVRE